MRNYLRTILYVVTSVTLLSCSSTTEEGAVGINRRQFMLASEAQVNEMSAQGYDQIKEASSKGVLDKNPQLVGRVNQIVNRLIAQVRVYRPDAIDWKWETHVIQSDELNAFCMPGGKIMVYSGLIEKLNLSDAEAAAVIGREIAHALREHGRERVSQEMLKEGVLQGAMATGKLDPKYAQAAASVTVVVLSLPHGRKQELEADKMGVELMARAGYNPEAAVTLWQKMGSAGGGKPPEFMSTHPSDERRISNIQELLPKVRPLYRP